MRHQASLARRGFSMVEVMTVIAIIAVLLGLLFPVLAGFRKSGQMTKSMSNMRQIAGWMMLYSSDNRDTVLPSQFDYCPEFPECDGYPGKVRSEISRYPVVMGTQHMGTWADILWTEFKLGVFPEVTSKPYPKGLDHDYRYDSPDGLLYGQRFLNQKPHLGLDFDNPLRSAANNTRHAFSRFDKATPYGAGAGEGGLPGYFAANNFFNADEEAEDKSSGTTGPAWPDRPATDQGRWYSQAQIRAPERSMYLVDSFAGEVIQPRPSRFKPELMEDPQGNFVDPTPEVAQENQVDFRYSDQCLMLFLDGHIEPQARWAGIEELEGKVGDSPTEPVKNRGIRIRRLDKR
jgi:prepilin-type N-terminal cleavage/methylation domain-containing protein